MTWTFAEINKVKRRGYVGLITKKMSNLPCMHEAMILSIGLSKGIENCVFVADCICCWSACRAVIPREDYHGPAVV